MNNVAKAVKPLANGPLAPRARRALFIRAHVALMIDDRDAQSDLAMEPDLSDFPAWTCQFFGANQCSEELTIADDDWAEDSVSDTEPNFDQVAYTNVSVADEDEFRSYNPLISAERWVEGRYRREFPHLWTVREGKPETPYQSNVQHDEYLKVLGWNADKCNRGWMQSHGGHGRQNTFWRRAIRQDRGHRRQFWNDTLDETVDFTSHDEEILTACKQHAEFKLEQELYALDQAYRNGEFADLWTSTFRYSFLSDEYGDYDWGDDDWDPDYDLDMSDYRDRDDDDDFDWSQDMAWFDIDELAEQERFDRLAETTPIHQHGGERGFKAIKAVVRNLSRPHHYLEVA